MLPSNRWAIQSNQAAGRCSGHNTLLWIELCAYDRILDCNASDLAEATSSLLYVTCHIHSVNYRP